MLVQSVRLRAVECTLQSVRRNLPHMILHRHAMCQQYDLLSNLIITTTITSNWCCDYVDARNICVTVLSWFREYMKRYVGLIL